MTFEHVANFVKHWTIVADVLSSSPTTDRKWRWILYSGEVLHERWSFLLRISCKNVTKSAVNCGFGHKNEVFFNEHDQICSKLRILSYSLKKTSFFCAVKVAQWVKALHKNQKANGPNSYGYSVQTPMDTRLGFVTQNLVTRTPSHLRVKKSNKIVEIKIRLKRLFPQGRAVGATK